MPEKILLQHQIKQLDAYTIAQEPISSVDLIERATDQFVQWYLQNFEEEAVCILCGKGNNGADGLSIARKLQNDIPELLVIILEMFDSSSQEYDIKYEELKNSGFTNIVHIHSSNDMSIMLKPYVLLIDAILGVGIRSSIAQEWHPIFQQINTSDASIISIDIPSGLHLDGIETSISLRSDYCYSFELCKLSFVLTETGNQIKHWAAHSIGLSQSFIDESITPYYLSTADDIQLLIKERRPFDHKYNFGHALIIAGSEEYMGSAFLSAKSCLRSGAGLLTAVLPTQGIQTMNAQVPEVICFDQTKFDYNFSKYKVIGIGPGLLHYDYPNFLNSIGIFEINLVLDAEAINFLASSKHDLSIFKNRAILTPHPGEFDRLFGSHNSQLTRIITAQKMAVNYQLIIVLKSRYTAVINSDGKVYFNTTGNPGMATAGSGDVLTGIITGLVAQQYSLFDAARLGVFLHGLSGDLAAEDYGEEALLASELIEYLGDAYQFIKQA